ncbi:MAG: hypothetical protein JXR51_00785 [Bacteroidales bacterium]|nr:hypothetical protein [Bacteroidales bacterium]MBN2755677.1 hypothetical protein [Bacteroidales bacterium]
MKKIYILLVALFALNSCGPTLESSKEDWTKNQEAITKLKAEYPVYATLIDQKLEAAKAIWTESEGISDEEKKVDKMEEANKLLSAGTVGNLRNIKQKVTDLKATKDKLLTMDFNSYKLENRTEDAVDEVKKAIKKAEAVIYLTPEEFDINEAPGQIDKAFNKLADSYKEVEAVISLINKEKAKIEKDKKAEEKKVSDEKVKDEQAKAQIKCEYCGTMNEAGSTKCKSCGANLPTN